MKFCRGVAFVLFTNAAPFRQRAEHFAKYAKCAAPTPCRALLHDKVFCMKYGCQSMMWPLRRVIVKTPQNAFCDQATIDSQWKELNFVDRPDFAVAVQQHEKLVALLQANGAEVLSLNRDSRTNLDSISPHDPGIINTHRAIVLP